MLTFGWSVHAAASSPAAMRLGQTIRFPCSRIMGVLPSLVDDPRQCTVRVTHCATEQGGKGSASDVAGRSTLKDREIRLALRHRAAARRSRQLSSAHPTRPRRATARGRRSLLRARTEIRESSCSPEKGRSFVEPAAVSPFAAWENFYVIVGSSAAALTGLQFVVVVLGAEARSIGPEGGAFGTPTVVHFCAALLISAIASVPWRAVSNAGLALEAVGVAGIVYMGGVIRRGLRLPRRRGRSRV